MRPKTRHICQVCGIEFYGRENQKNCSLRCGWKKSSHTYYEKKKGKKNENREKSQESN